MKIKNSLVLGLALAVLVISTVLGFVINANRNLREDKRHMTANIEALNDSVRVTRTKNGELEYNRKTLITTIQELSLLNESLAVEVKKTKGKVVYIQGTKVTIHDTIKIPVQVVDTAGGFIANVHLDTTYSPGNYRILDHKLRFLPGDTSATFTEELGLSVITGLKKNEKGDYEILFRSDFPGIRSVAIDGAYIPRNQLKSDFRPPRISVGLQIGYSPLAYDFTEKGLRARNQVTAGFGINYRIIK